jgi:hypothetical protein
METLGAPGESATVEISGVSSFPASRSPKNFNRFPVSPQFRVAIKPIRKKNPRKRPLAITLKRGKPMKGIRGRHLLAASILILGGMSGCQTWNPEAGMTLPSGHYLRHLPQYFPPSPQYPAPRETAALEEALAQQPALAPQPPGGGLQ